MIYFDILLIQKKSNYFSINIKFFFDSLISLVPADELLLSFLLFIFCSQFLSQKNSISFLVGYSA